MVLVVCGDLRWSVEVCGGLQQSMEVHGSPQKSMMVLWWIVVVHGVPWCSNTKGSMMVYGGLWWSVVAYGST